MTRPVVDDFGKLVKLSPGTVLLDANGRVLTVGTDRVRGWRYDGATSAASFVDIPLPATVLWSPDEPEPEPEPEPRPIELKDVRVGDTVSVVRDGVTHTGVAGFIGSVGDLYVTSRGWCTIGGTYLSAAISRGEATLFRLHRPEPVPVLPTEIGSVILDVHVVGSETVYPLGVLVDGDVIPWRLIDAAQDEDDYGRWVTPYEIVAWTPAKVVPA